MTTELQTYARRAHAAGLTVVPVKTDGSKAPAGFWKQHQTERPTVDYLDAWFDDTHPRYDGLGYICGRVSGNLEMLEFEGRAVEAGLYDQTLEAADALGLDFVRRLDAGYTEISPAGGIHWLYRVADHPVDGNLKLARQPGIEPNGHEVVDVLIETRGEGGFTVAAPSAGRTHPTGNPWRILHGDVDTIATITADERKQLHDLCRTFDRMPAPVAEHLGHQAQRARLHPDHEGDPRPGDRYNAEHTWTDILGPLGWTVVYQRGDITYWRRPGKAHGVSATTNALGTDRLKVFSSSTVFDTESTYDKLGAYALLNHAGDISAAARALTPATERTTPDSMIGDTLRPNAAMLNPPAGLIPMSHTSGGLIGQPLNAADTDDQGDEDDEVTSWAPIDLGPYLDGTRNPPTPTVGRLSDGRHLFYEERVNAIFGASGDGKTWIADAIAAQVLDNDEVVLWCDLEDSPDGTIDRLRSLGVTDEAIRHRFRYIQPDEQFGPDAKTFLTGLIAGMSPKLCVIDSTGESLALEGLNPDKDNEVAAWGRALPAWIAKQGPAIVLIDHTPKGKDRDPLFSIGSQRKRAMITGAAYLAQTIIEFGRNRAGKLQMVTAKDRGGHHQRGTAVAMFHLDATGRPYAYRFEPMFPEDEERIEEERRAAMREAVSRHVEENDGIGQRALEQGVTGRSDDVRQAVEWLIAEGYVEVDQGGRGNAKRHVCRRPYRANGIEDMIAEAA